jgi:P27 family predicted phage terminase small subunit
MPDIPDAMLTPLARDLLQSISAPLLARGVLTAGDGVALIALVNAVADGVNARRLIDAAGGEVQNVENAAGKVRYALHPAVALRDGADRRLQFWATKFGLTPQSRLSVPKAAPDEPKESANPFSALD